MQIYNTSQEQEIATLQQLKMRRAVEEALIRPHEAKYPPSSDAKAQHRALSDETLRAAAGLEVHFWFRESLEFEDEEDLGYPTEEKRPLLDTVEAVYKIRAHEAKKQWKEFDGKTWTVIV